jgi:hypothetical protein
MMPDPAFYAECLQSSFDELAAATAAPAARKTTARKRPSTAASKER